jgi:hypothetical protein
MPNPSSRHVPLSPAALKTASLPSDVWERYTMALDDVANRMTRITKAFRTADVPYALAGGQAVAIWVATRDPAAVRTTKDVDLLIRRTDLGRARAAARSVEMDYFETMGVGMFLDREDPNPRHAVHLIWAGEMLRPGLPLPSPDVDNSTTLPGGHKVVSLEGLVRMKLMANRDQDRVHLRDMIDVGLIHRDMLAGLPAELATRLETLLEAVGE